MTDRALVIGLDYANAAWELRAAVRDALAFADWVTAKDSGRASSETLTLLLAPHPDRPVTDRKFELATEPAIRRALFDHKKLDGATSSRLWFFYAGHGLAPAGGGPDEAPIVVPEGVTDLDFYRSNPIDLGSWIREMQVCAPAEQIFFVDACRGLVVSEDVVTATKTLFFDLSKVSANAQAHQSVLFATTAGQLANEQQLHGLFSGALLQGLAGNGPELEPDADTQEFVLTFSALVAFTKRRIQAKAEEVRRQHKTLPTQDPAESLFRTDGSMVLARLSVMPTSKVRVFVKPEEAAVSGTAGIRMFDPWTKTWPRQGSRSSPLAVPIEWDLPASSHKIEVESKGFENWSRKITVTGPMELSAELVETSTSSPSDGGLESLIPLVPESTSPPNGAELAPGTTGRLRVRPRDRFARIEIFDGSGKRIEATWEHFDANLPVGAYRIEVALPTEQPIVRSVLLTADEDEIIDDIVPDSQLTDRLPPGAGMLGPHGGFTHPSEQFGPATTTHLGSLLAWAAWAAQYGNGDGVKLRAIGVDRLPPAAGQCFVRVLIGDARAPGPNPQGGPLETLVLDVCGTSPVMRPVPALVGFAEQCAVQVHGGSVTLSTGGLNPKRIPVPFVADHVWTIIVVRESTQRTEIHRYLQRLQPRDMFDDTIRLVEQNWRALEARAPLFDDEVARLLSRDLDALSLAVLGYRCAREERANDVAAIVQRLANSELCDRHVLAALLGDRDAHMQQAVTAPFVPVVGDGYRSMEAWLTDHFEKQSMPPPIAPEPFTGGLWTTFDPRGQPVISKAFPVDNPPAWAYRLLGAARATARIEPAIGDARLFVGTGFLIGDCALAFTDFIAQTNPRGAKFGDEWIAIEAIVATSNDQRHGAIARLAPSASAPAPLAIRWELPEVGRRIAVIGHPLFTFTPTIVTLAAFTTMPNGEKMIMPGVITEVTDDKLTYECWTTTGVAGGPIVDLETGEVLGIHHSGKYLGGGKKVGWGTPAAALRELLETPVDAPT